MISRLSSVNLAERSLCSGLSLTNIMDFKDERSTKKFEELACNMSLTSELVKGTMVDPFNDMVSA